jgi:uncharacterized protein
MRAGAHLAAVMAAFLAAGGIVIAAEAPVPEPKPDAAGRPVLAPPEGTTSVPDLTRFGERPGDPAYAAFQRGLYITALNLALPEAEKGALPSQMLAAEIYGRGLGVARNVAEATRWYMAAAAQGDAEAQLQAALILLGDKPLDPANANRAEALTMLRAASDAGNAFAAFNLAQIVIAEKTGETGAREAMPLFEIAAKAGIPGALYAMSRFHRIGGGGLSLDGEKARDYLERAARAGLDTAQLDLGVSFADGTFGRPDYKSAFLWLRRAAESGNVLAGISLAKLYAYGLGVEGDPVTAAAWYIRAKRSGLTDPALEDFMDGLADDERARALTKANERL